ncbi:M48 family metallopeptidase [Thalassotalea sp. Y01]|nr:M48 family metallopeptidase [Thalassotalea sp. Y01]
MMNALRYLQGYPEQVVEQAQQLLTQQKLGPWLLARYPDAHQIGNDGQLRDYVQSLKNQFLKKSAPLSKVCFDNKLHVINNALGTHSYISKVHGSKIKRVNEIRIASIFKQCPEPFLNMICVHELAHIKEKQHNKAFYQLCQHMMHDYHQVELHLRLYLVQTETHGRLYSA